MVSALLADTLSDPLSVLYSLAAAAAAAPHLSLPAHVAHHFRTLLAPDNAFREIPALDASHPPQCYAHHSHPLVRFRAMVQDTSSSSELYPLTLPDRRPGGWGLAETSLLEPSLDVHNLRERDVLWAVSIPGESPFITELLDDPDRPTSARESASNLFRHKDPLSREDHLGVQIKIYDTSAAQLKPTELHTFVGFLTFEHAPSIEDATDDAPPVPTLHVLFSVDHPLGLLQFPDPLGDHGSVPRSTLRDEFIQWIASEALGGDVDAAEWVLIVCIARVQSRQPPLLPPSLTISRFPKAEHGTVTPALVHVLRHVLPLFVDVPLSLAVLNTRLFAPESRDESLRAGLLQLPAGTTVLLSESGIAEGNVTEAGVKNNQALRSAVLTQTLDYQFPFTSYQFPIDCSFVILSEGTKSAFVETAVNVPLTCNGTNGCYKPSESIQLPPRAQLDAFRHLVGAAKTAAVRVTEEVSQFIQEDFVRERQSNKAVTPDDLMMRMSVARLMALSRHETELSKDVWQKTKELDERRKRRF